MLKKTKTKVKQKVIKKETKPKRKIESDHLRELGKGWDEHNKWLDSFRGKTVVSKND